MEDLVAGAREALRIGIGLAQLAVGALVVWVVYRFGRLLRALRVQRREIEAMPGGSEGELTAALVRLQRQMRRLLILALALVALGALILVL